MDEKARYLLSKVKPQKQICRIPILHITELKMRIVLLIPFVADKASICHSFIGELSFEIYAAKKKALKFKKELSF